MQLIVGHGDDVLAVWCDGNYSASAGEQLEAVRGSGNDEKIRIISARRASRKERAAYASGSAD
jgi:hypothetical protein